MLVRWGWTGLLCPCRKSGSPLLAKRGKDRLSTTVSRNSILVALRTPSIASQAELATDACKLKTFRDMGCAKAIERAKKKGATSLADAGLLRVDVTRLGCGRGGSPVRDVMDHNSCTRTAAATTDREQFKEHVLERPPDYFYPVKIAGWSNMCPQ